MGKIPKSVYKECMKQINIAYSVGGACYPMTDMIGRFCLNPNADITVHSPQNSIHKVRA